MHLGLLGFLGAVCPNSGQTVRLQFQCNRGAIRICFARPVLEGLNLTGGPQQILDVMTDFMSDNVGFGEVAGSLEPIAQVSEKAHVEIDLLVIWTIERSHCGLTEPARRFDGSAKEDKFRRRIGSACLSEDVAPCV